jgi:hypothetical protein
MEDVRRPRPSGSDKLGLACLVRRTQEGDSAAFACLVERTREPLARFCRRLLSSQSQAEDLVQESLLRAYRAIGRLEDPARFEAWLFAIAANLARKWWRQQARWPLSLESLAATYPDVPWDTSSARHTMPDRVVEEVEQARLLQAAIDSLPRPLGQVVALHYLDGLSYGEVAAALDVPVSTIKGRLFKSRTRLRQGLAATGAFGDRSATNARRKKGAMDAMSQASPAGPEPTGPAPVEVIIDSIRMKDGHPSRMVVLKQKDAERYLCIVVGVPEGDTIALKLNNVDVPRPMTHDLMLSGFGALGADVRRVVVNDRRGDLFYGQIVLDADGREIVLDSRPSDALALAVRAEVPIFVAESVLARCGTDQKPGTPPAAADS